MRYLLLEIYYLLVNVLLGGVFSNEIYEMSCKERVHFLSLGVR